MLTTQDFIARGALEEAEQAAQRADDCIDVARAWVERGDLAQARRCIAMGLERAQGEHWPSRNAAELLLRQLGDREAAAAALGSIEQRLSSSARGYEWILLARAFREVLGDENAVRRCLASARRQARRAQDLASLAEGYVEFLDDPASARELLDEAEGLARQHGEHRALWFVAIAWRDGVRDDARARSALAIWRQPPKTIVLPKGGSGAGNSPTPFARRSGMPSSPMCSTARCPRISNSSPSTCS